jgi:hypothetical protein
VPVVPEAPADPGALVNEDGFPTVVRDVVLSTLALDPEARPTFDAICTTLRTACDVFQEELEASDARDAAEFLSTTHVMGVGGWLRSGEETVGARGSGSGGGGSTPRTPRTSASGTRARTPASASGSGENSRPLAAAPPPVPAAPQRADVSGGTGFASPTPRPPRRRAAAGSPVAGGSGSGGCTAQDGNPEVVPGTPSAWGGGTPAAGGGKACTPVAVGHQRRMVGSSPGGHSAGAAGGPPAPTASPGGSAHPAVGEDKVLGAAKSPRAAPGSAGSPRRWALGGGSAGLGEGGRVVTIGGAQLECTAGDWPSEL